MGTTYSSDEDKHQPTEGADPLLENTLEYNYDDEEYSSYRLCQLASVQQEARDLFESKNKDYGDAFANYGVIGVLVRMGDKIQRSLSITNNGVSMVNSETLRDTLIDLVNYACMGVMLLDEDAIEPSTT
jgi:hypothetical protein